MDREGADLTQTIGKQPPVEVGSWTSDASRFSGLTSENECPARTGELSASGHGFCPIGHLACFFDVQHMHEAIIQFVDTQDHGPNRAA
jgi:hypothetical protein